MKAMLQLSGISKRFGATQVLHPLDLDIPAGTTLALLGQSGCGKSTLLRIIMGLLAPDSGKVLLEDQPLTAASDLATRRRIGYVIQEGGLFPHWTARENVTVVARFLRQDAVTIENRVRELAELTHLPLDLLDRYPTQLSGGQRQRLGLMRALMLDPPLLLLDEPLGALDPVIRSELQQDLKSIFQTLNKTVILVTHDIHEAAFLADEIVLLQQGRIVQHGPIEELVFEPRDEFVTQFINAQRSALPERNP